MLHLLDDKTLAPWYPAVASPLGLAMVRMGDAEDALPLLRRSVEATPYRGGSGNAIRLAHLAEGELALGDLAAAEATARRGLAQAAKCGERGFEAHCRATLAGVCRAAGKQDEAAELLSQARDIADHLGLAPLRDACAEITQATTQSAIS